jgi:hypothetical protein
MTEEKEKTKPTKGVSRREFIAGAVGSAAALGAMTTLVPGVAAAVPGASGGLKAASASAATGQDQPTTTSQFWLPDHWDYQADVVCVGYGGAGATAAITACDAGASVLIIEKTPSLAQLGVKSDGTPNMSISGGGGTTHISDGSLNWVNDITLGAIHMNALSGGATPMDVCAAWASEIYHLPTFLARMGVPLSGVSDTPSPEYPALVGSSCVRGGSVVGWGPVLFQCLDNQVQARPRIQVLFNTTAKELIQNPITKEILGVVAYPTDMSIYSAPDFQYPITNTNSSSGSGSLTGALPAASEAQPADAAAPLGTPIYIRANKAVALTCGGFMYNEEMKLNFLRLYPFVSYAWKFNTGDGISMAEKVGAALWHTNFVIGRPTPWYPQNWPGTAGYIGGYPATNNWILVDKYGNRFENEKALPSHSQLMMMGDYDGRKCEYTRIPVYVICDSVAIKAGPVGSSFSGAATLPAALGGGYKQWSLDNSVEIAKGWIQQGADIPTLVANLLKPSPQSTYSGIKPVLDPVITAASVNTYNAACAAGVDNQFGTPKQYLAPISTPPYYGWSLWPGCSDNPGGPKRNANAQIVDPNEHPIPRLYGAGANGCALGLLYTRGGGFLTDGLVFGQIAGRHMAAESPWS